MEGSLIEVTFEDPKEVGECEHQQVKGGGGGLRDIGGSISRTRRRSIG